MHSSVGDSHESWVIVERLVVLQFWNFFQLKILILDLFCFKAKKIQTLAAFDGVFCWVLLLWNTTNPLDFDVGGHRTTVFHIVRVHNSSVSTFFIFVHHFVERIVNSCWMPLDCCGKNGIYVFYDTVLNGF